MKRTFKNRAKRSPETNLRIKLFDTEKGFVGEFEVNPSVKTLPHIVLWGDRVFVQGTGEDPGTYHENPAAAYRIPGQPRRSSGWDGESDKSAG
jgi:hypothetical protein